MQSELATRRRVLRVTYQRYVDADRAWTAALQEMATWFPIGARPYRASIGNPGSRLRRLYEARARALVQLEAAYEKFETARRRMGARRRGGRSQTIFLFGTA